MSERGFKGVTFDVQVRVQADKTYPAQSLAGGVTQAVRKMLDERFPELAVEDVYVTTVKDDRI